MLNPVFAILPYFNKLKKANTATPVRSIMSVSKYLVCKKLGERAAKRQGMVLNFKKEMTKT